MSILHEGREAEKMCRLWLINKGFKVFQVDWIAQSPEGQYFSVEAKYQEKFKPPPFYGHGLPLWQVKARLSLQDKKGIRAILAILDKETREWYWQYLDILELGEFYDTKGTKPRRIYPLINFVKEKPIDQLILVEA